MWLWTSMSFLDQGPIRNRTLPFRSFGLGLAAALAAADGAVDAAAPDGDVAGDAAPAQASRIAPTILGARPSWRSRVTKVRRDILPATYASASVVVWRSRFRSISV